MWQREEIVVENIIVCWCRTGKKCSGPVDRERVDTHTHKHGRTQNHHQSIIRKWKEMGGTLADLMLSIWFLSIVFATCRGGRFAAGECVAQQHFRAFGLVLWAQIDGCGGEWTQKLFDIVPGLSNGMVGKMAFSWALFLGIVVHLCTLRMCLDGKQLRLSTHTHTHRNIDPHLTAIIHENIKFRIYSDFPSIHPNSANVLHKSNFWSEQLTAFCF